MGKIEVAIGHVLLHKSAAFGISSFMQQQMCFMGQLEVFEDASESFRIMTGVKVSSSQIQRVCHYYGQEIEAQQQKAIAEGGKDKRVVHKERYYAMLDGGMVLTREEKWKEMKLARLFDSSQTIEVSKDRGYIASSTYIAHLGNHKPFLKKVEYHIDSMGDVVFVADGAPWIWKWVEANYPESTQILDYYHAKEHLCRWAEIVFKDNARKQEWIDEQSLLLLNNKADTVLKNISELKVYTKRARKERSTLLEYYSTHIDRMNYKTYRENNLMIGSGPIEAAHRHVIQQRMKLSGQRWTRKGAQQIANLRAIYRSNKWIEIIEMVKRAA